MSTPAVIHPRPNPIVAAMYTLRDMDVGVIVLHGPAGCSFMASRPLENAGVRVVTSALKEDDLIFGGSEPLIRTLKEVRAKFDPKTVAVVAPVPVPSSATTSPPPSAGRTSAGPSSPWTATAASRPTPRGPSAP
ncbi:nitrogenase component 1 [Candidatus Methanomethylophilus sp. 1R26]|uniref:nitrogenase component 1 n=1 Tax=Candidatus Methanomethylophilus sp. 1R26 TaxID=1769296 RepID=UPI001F38EDD5|nr:nitrogenase component 1 [Candidatus Methanomethylophilus sp. 1R26]